MFPQEIINQIANHYGANRPKIKWNEPVNWIADIKVEENQVTVTITEEESSGLDSIDILIIPNAKIEVSTYAQAETSFCERYGVVTESEMYIVYTYTVRA